jgi:hypothetical protein
MIPVNKIFLSRFVEPMLKSMREESQRLKEQEKRKERKKLKKIISDEFKKSPMYDKKSIMDMIDKLEPKEIFEIVEFIKQKTK